MVMSDELKDLILVIDSREKSRKRIEAVSGWFEKHGGVVEVDTLQLCDYHIEGLFRGAEINLGIEAKSLADFSGSYPDLSDKLARSYKLYTEVGLFVEVGGYTFIPDDDDFHATIKNPAVRNGEADVLSLAVFENMLASFQKEGIHVRQLRSEEHFPYAIGSLLINISKPIHSGLHITKEVPFSKTYINLLGHIEGIGYAKAQKIAQHWPNLQWLVTACEEDLQEHLGKSTGHKLYQQLHNHELETDEWKNCSHQKEVPILPSTDKSCSHPGGFSKSIIPPPIEPPQPPGDSPGHSVPTPTSDSNLLINHKGTYCEIIKRTCQEGYCNSCYVYISCHQSDDPRKHNHEELSSPTTSGVSRHPGFSGTTSSPAGAKTQPGIFSPDDRPGHYPPINVSTDPDDSSYLNEKSEYKVMCRHCHTQILPADDDGTGFCHSCITDRKKPKEKMGLKQTIKTALESDSARPKTMQEIVNTCEGWAAGTVWDKVMAGVKTGLIKKITDPNTGKTTFQKS